MVVQNSMVMSNVSQQDELSYQTLPPVSISTCFRLLIEVSILNCIVIIYGILALPAHALRRNFFRSLNLTDTVEQLYNYLSQQLSCLSSLPASPPV